MSDSSGRRSILPGIWRRSAPVLACLMLGACASVDLTRYESLIPVYDRAIATTECTRLARTLSDGIADSYTDSFSGDGADEIGVAVGAGINEARVRGSIRKRCLEKARSAAPVGRDMT
ncbi:MAG: hypothetical protein J7499_01925 [Sphingopyxis sp.]|nr:hypothetical protein [Sphingopyxis sp.]